MDNQSSNETNGDGRQDGRLTAADDVPLPQGSPPTSTLEKPADPGAAGFSPAGCHVPTGTASYMELPRFLHIYHHYPNSYEIAHSADVSSCLCSLCRLRGETGDHQAPDARLETASQPSSIEACFGTLQGLLQRAAGAVSPMRPLKAGRESSNRSNGRQAPGTTQPQDARGPLSQKSDPETSKPPESALADSSELLRESLAQDTEDSASAEGSMETSEPEDGQTESWDDEAIPPPPERRKLWQGIDGIGVMTFGVALPLIMTALCIASCPKRATLVILNHPVETLLEIFLLLTIPFMNFRVWSALCRNDARFSLSRGLLLGMSIAASLIISCLSFAAIPAGYAELQAAIGTDFTTGFFIIGALAAAAALSGAYIVRRIRQARELPKSRLSVLTNVIAGLLIGAMAFAAAETRSWCVRLSEKKAMAGERAQRDQGLEMLRRLNAERELLMECSDSRAAGVAGLFIQLKQADMPQLYFAAVGKPFRDENANDFSSMPDEYLRRHVVGAPVKGLSLVRSALNGAVSPDALSSTISWTYVFRNDTETSQEARAEIALPPGAVISGLTVWQGGEPQEAAFAASGKADGQYNWVQVDHNSPAIISDLGRGRYLFHCYPITQDQQLKVEMKVMVPLNLESLDAASLTLPRFIASNFGLEGEHALRLEANHKMTSKAKNLTSSKGPSGNDVISGNLDSSQLEHTALIVTAKRDASIETIMAPDILSGKRAREAAIAKAEAERKEQEEESAQNPQQQVVLMIDGSKGVRQQLEDVQTVISRKRSHKRIKTKVPKLEPKWVVRTIKEVTSKAPKRLLVVIDGSQSTRKNLPEIQSALKSIPSSIPVSVVVASQEDKVLSEPTPVKEALPKLDKVVFGGGQDNLKAVVKAAEVAGQAQGGVVLWIHGAQPALNRDIYIMSPFACKPALFELSLDSGETDTLEYFKNHGEISSFQPLQRGEDLAQDLKEFFARWQTGRRDFQVSYSLLDKAPASAILPSARERKELLTLNARKMVDDRIRQKNRYDAARIAVEYQIVSPVSCVAVLSTASTESAELQGATNGTIGPEGGDATVIMGVNTAGTVRVNNLANLEALLSIVSNLVELACVLAGVAALLHGLCYRAVVHRFLGVNAELTPGTRIGIGVALIAAGLMLPSMVNWFVTSARDANLFS